MEAIRHGDVVLLKVGDFRARGNSLNQVEKKSETLALGELTGHSHQLHVLNEVENLLVARGATAVVDDTAWMIEVPEGGAELVHEEHDRIEIKPGEWLAFQQREAWTDPTRNGWRESYVYD